MAKTNLGLREEIEECKRDIHVGMKVYRHRYRRIEEGAVVDIFKCSLDGRGDIQRNEDGGWTAYAAAFTSESLYGDIRIILMAQKRQKSL